MAPTRSDFPGGVTFVELIRLAVVVLTTAASLELARQADVEGTNELLAAALGAGVGYLLGGVIGRFAQGRISDAEASLERVSAAEMITGGAGAVVGLVLAASVTWPVLLFGGKIFTVPIAAMVGVTMAWTGLRVGRHRSGDLLRFLGTGGRLPSNARASGPSYKLVDTSALIDGRLVDVCRDGWMEGTLLVPEFVLYELQGLADASDPERRQRGQRGLDTLASLQRLSSVGVEVLADDPGGEEVDVKLLKVAKRRGTAVITTDANLARVAEVQGVGVRNLHQLASSLRPPVLPGELLDLRISRRGREAGQGVAYLPDGTMVVVEGAAERIGDEVTAEVTSVMSNAQGRMLFATAVDPARDAEGDHADQQPDATAAAERARPRLLRGGDGGR